MRPGKIVEIDLVVIKDLHPFAHSGFVCRWPIRRKPSACSKRVYSTVGDSYCVTPQASPSSRGLSRVRSRSISGTPQSTTSTAKDVGKGPMWTACTF